eukprot:15342599-Ditylum_brightwellii.AAC.1
MDDTTSIDASSLEDKEGDCSDCTDGIYCLVITKACNGARGVRSRKDNNMLLFSIAYCNDDVVDADGDDSSFSEGTNY